MIRGEDPLGDLVRRVTGLREFGMPAGAVASRALVGGHIVRKALRSAWRRRRKLRDRLATILAEALFFELAHRNLGTRSMIRNGHGFFPHIFMPDYHGPHFDKSLLRLAFPNRGPNIIYLSTTGICPCACEYCFAGAGGDGTEDIGEEAVLEVARAVARTGAPLVNISGGEPLTRFDRLLETIRILNTNCEVRMFTSGIGLDAGRLAALREAGLKGVFISLDTKDPERYDAARRYSGAFKAAVAALELCAEAGMLTFINCVVGQNHFRRKPQVRRFLKFVERIDPRIVVNFLPQLATGRGADADSFRKPKDCQRVADRITAVADELRRPIGMLFGAVDYYLGCPGAGGKLLNVDIKGNVTVCISQAALGNVLKEPFEDIYRRFVERCHRLKVGFFCCRVTEQAQGGILNAAESQLALNAFYASTPDSDWQQLLDRYHWLFKRLFVESAMNSLR